MKKVYFLLILSFLSFKNFGATWYANTGSADNVLNWWSTGSYTGTHPVDFVSPTDIWIIDGNMTTGGVWTLGGTLTLNSGTFKPSNYVSIGTLGMGGDLIMNGGSVFNASGVSGTFSNNNDINVNLYGNLFVNDSSSWNNDPEWTHIHFSNTSSSWLSPQTISWTSSQSGIYAGIIIDYGCTVHLLTNVTLPTDHNQPEVNNGTLVCDNFILNVNSDSFVMNNGATFYTQNAGGIDGTITNGTYYFFNGSASYIFNGSSTQITGMLLPTSIGSVGSVLINNAANVILSQPTVFQDGASLTLTSGSLILGANNLAMAGLAPLTGTFSGSSMIVTNGAGQLIKQFVADGSYTYPVGDASGNFTPATINMTAATYTSGSSVGVNAVNTKHPANANVNDYLNRYWSVLLTDITTPVYTATATYVPSDVTGTEANISAGEYAGLPWHKFGVTDVTTHTLTTGTISDMASDISGITTAVPSLSTTPNTQICFGNLTTLSVISPMTDSPFTYTWNPAASLSASTGISVVATPTITTTYTVTMTDANGLTATSTTTVTVNPNPTVDTVMGGGNYCAGGTGSHILLSLSDTGINYQAYHLGSSIGGTVAGTGILLDMGPQTLAGSYFVMATNTHTGCSSMMADSANVGIIPVVVPTITLSSVLGDTICAGTMATFNTSITHGGITPVYIWTRNGANVGTDSMSYSGIPTDGNVFVVRMVSNEVCAIPDTVTDTFVMHVFPNGTPTVSITSNLGDTVCNGTGIILTAAPTFGGYTPTYTWVKNTINVSTSSSYAYTPANGDHIICILNSDYRCRLATVAYSNVIDMNVETPIVPYVTIVGYPGMFIAKGSPDTLVATIYNGGTAPSYQWYVNDTAVIGATSSVFIRSNFKNQDSVTCKVTRNDACSLSSVNSVVIKVYKVGVPVVGNENEISLIPNPNKGTFAVKGTIGIADENVTIEIVNMLGQVVYNSKAAVVNGQLNERISTDGTIANGTYILSLHSSNGVNTFRFVVEK